MAMYDKAYSKEINRIVNTTEADILYSKNQIRNKTQFICIDENCGCPLTCANLEKPKNLRKRDPYFRISKKEYPHSESCSVTNGTYKNLIGESELETETEQKVSDLLPDVFHTERPPHHSEESKTELDKTNGKYIYQNTTKGSKPIKATNHTYYNLGDLVSKYFKLKENKLYQNRQIIIDGRTLSYAELFKRIYMIKIPINQNKKPPRFIYHAKVKRGQLKEGRIIIELQAKCDISSQDVTIPKVRAYIVIPVNLLHTYRHREYLKEKIDTILKKNNHIHAYIYASPMIVDLSNNQVINFLVDNLDLVEFTYLPRKSQ